jgi:hypothetical protein
MKQLEEENASMKDRLKTLAEEKSLIASAIEATKGVINMQKDNF